MNTKNTVRLMAFAAAALLLLHPARAAIVPANVVNADLGVTSFPGATGGPHSPVYSGLAAGPVTAGSTWNEVAFEGKNAGFGNFGPTGTLLASDGITATSITVSLTSANFYHTDENALAAPNGNLLNDYAYNTAGTSLTIGGVTAGFTYDLYIYSQNGNYKSATTTFAVNGGSGLTVNNPVNEPAGGAFTLTGNYVVFTGLTGPRNHTFTVAMTSTGGAGSLNGFQLVQTAVPEPSALLVAALLGLPLLGCRRRPG